MAELPRYRPLGAAISSMPSVDFAQTGRVQASVYSTIDKALGAMADYVYEKEVNETKRKAARYAFENPVSAEDVKRAIETDTLEEVVGDPDTVFGAITTVATAKQLRIELSNLVSNRASEFAAMVETGVMLDPSEIQTELAGMIDGHTGVIAQLNPDEAIQYAASANSYASTVYKLALEKNLELRQSALKDTALQNIRTLPNRLEAIYTEYAGDDADTQNKVNAALKDTNESLALTGDGTFISTQRQNIVGVDQTARLAVLTKHAVSSEENYRQALNGNFGDRYTPLFAQLDVEGKAAARTQIREEMKRRRDELKFQETEKRDAQRRTSQELQVELSNTTYGSARYNEIISELQAIAIDSEGDVITQDFISNLDKSIQGDDRPNERGEFLLRKDIYEGRVSDLDTFMKVAETYGVTPKQMVEVMPLLDSKEKDRKSNANKIANGYAKIVPGQITTKDQANAYLYFMRELDRRFEQAVQEWEDGGATGPRPLIDDIAKQLDTDKRTGIEQENIDRHIRNLNDLFGAEGNMAQLSIVFDEYTTLQQVEDALEAYGLEGRELTDAINRAKSQINLIRKALERRDLLSR